MISSIIPAPERTSPQLNKPPETHTGTTTSWLSLVTSPPIDPRCSSHLFGRGGSDLTLVAFDPLLEIAANITCLPQEAVEWYTQKILPSEFTARTVSSLGPLVCPDAYTTASTSKKDKTSTMVYCCPSNYDFATPADHGMLYGCTSQRTQKITVHFSAHNSAPSITTLGTGVHSKARNVAGVAVNGWMFGPMSALISATPTPTSHGDVWAMRHIGVTTAAFCGIILGSIAVIVLFFISLYFFIRRKYVVQPRTAKPDEEGMKRARNSTISEDRMDLNPTRDVELEDFGSSRNRVPSNTETVVRHTERSVSENEGSSAADDDGERTA